MFEAACAICREAPGEANTLLRAQIIGDGSLPYNRQVFWAGLATVAYLPATAIPVAPPPDGQQLPVALQAVGPEWGDRTTLAFARMLSDFCAAAAQPGSGEGCWQVGRCPRPRMFGDERARC